MATTLRNFSLLNVQGINVTATNVSQIRALNANDLDIVLVNHSLVATVYVRTRTSTVEADTSAMPILPGEKSVWAKGNTGGSTKYIAFVLENDATAVLSIIQGLGA